MPSIITNPRRFVGLLHDAIRIPSNAPVALAYDETFAYGALVYKDVDAGRTKVRLVVKPRGSTYFVTSNGNFKTLARAKQAIHVLSLAYEWVRSGRPGVTAEQEDDL